MSRNGLSQESKSFNHREERLQSLSLSVWHKSKWKIYQVDSPKWHSCLRTCEDQEPPSSWCRGHLKTNLRGPRVLACSSFLWSLPRGHSPRLERDTWEGRHPLHLHCRHAHARLPCLHLGSVLSLKCLRYLWRRAKGLRLYSLCAPVASCNS